MTKVVILSPEIAQKHLRDALHLARTNPDPSARIRYWRSASMTAKAIRESETQENTHAE